MKIYLKSGNSIEVSEEFKSLILSSLKTAQDFNKTKKFWQKEHNTIAIFSEVDDKNKQIGFIKVPKIEVIV